MTAAEKLPLSTEPKGEGYGDKRAPVQGLARGIPWSLHLEACEAYCKQWSPQPALVDLEGKNCRGGFAIEELDMLIPGWIEKLCS